ncbi:MAG: EFR1 family ferrodoxin [Elusimicrobiota bacterium]|nr:EFR1 family ferrodoxin [Elusimicrobiota bacterium]
MKTFYFTGTGNSLSVAKKIGGNLCSIPQMIKNKEFFHEDDAIGIVFPCYGFDVPNIVREFLSKATLKANYFFAIMTYGNMSGAGLQNLEKLAKEKNIKFHYTNEILMIDNFLPGFDINVQLKNEQKKDIDRQLIAIVNDIKYRKVNLVKKKGIFTRMFSAIVSKMLSITGLEDKNFRVDKSCIKCGNCAKVCPRANITVETENPVYHHRCEYCMACINACHLTSIHIKGEKNAKRFRNRNITLQEIINSNNCL